MRRHLLLAVLIFNSLSAIGGGLGLIVGVLDPSLSWLEGTIFPDYVIPGILLAGVVGGSALAAVIEQSAKKPYATGTALLSGFIMCAWIVNQIAFTQQYSWLQLIYFTLGGLVVSLTYTSAKRFLIYRQQHR